MNRRKMKIEMRMGGGEEKKEEEGRNCLLITRVQVR